MRAALLLILLATPVFSADQASIDRIQTILDSREVARKNVERLKIEVEKIEADIGVRDGSGRLRPIDDLGATQYARRLLGLGADKYEEYSRLTNEYKSSQESFRGLSAQAIQLAMDAYKVVPTKSSGQIVSGPPVAKTDDDVPGFIGNHIDFSPTFSLKTPDGAAGYTDDSGRVIIGPRAFEYPGKLAFTIFHESEHFERLLTPGLDLRNVPGEEVSTREKERPALKSRFDLKDKDIVGFDTVLKSEKIRAKKWATLIGQGFDPYKKHLQTAFPGGYRPLWLEEGEIDVVNDILGRAKTLREREQDAQLNRTITDLALRSCDAPGSVSQEELNALPRPHEADYISRNPYPLDVRPCVAKVYEYLGKGGVDASEVARLSLPPTKPTDLVPLPPVPRARPALSIGELELLGMRVASIRACASSVQGVNQVLRSMNWANFQHARGVDACAGSFSGCELRVFRRLVQFGRAWRPGMTISVDEVMAATAEPGNTQPSSGPIRSTPPPDPCYYNELGHRICPE